MSLKLVPDDTVIVVLDVQEQIARAVPDGDRDAVVRQVERLVEAARHFELPLLHSALDAERFGATLAPLAAAFAALGERAHPAPRNEFDASTSGVFLAALEATGRKSVVLVGMESHASVYLSARGLVGAGYAVHVPVDATCSRDPHLRSVARGLWERAGAIPTLTETAILDLLGSTLDPAAPDVLELLRG